MQLPSVTRFWFEFEFKHYNELPPGFGLGCGVSACHYDDAIFILSKEVFNGAPMPPIKKVIKDVDLSILNAEHILPNSLPPVWRGIWYPSGYSYFK